MKQIRKSPLNKTHPEIAAQAVGWDPSKVTSADMESRLWRCARGHEWRARASNRAGASKTGCPFCSNRRVLKGFNDLLTTHPEIAAEADGWNPDSLTAGSHQKRQWRCTDGHTYITTPYNRVKGSQCHICTGQKPNIGINDLATTHPNLLHEIVDGNPNEVTAGSNRKFTWKCNRGHSYVTSPKQRTSGRGCSVCAGKVVLSGFNDLATVNPVLALQADGWDPRTIAANSEMRKPWRGACGHVWTAQIGNRNKGAGCPICGGKQILVGFNDLLSTHPEIAMEADGWDPRTVMAGSNKKVKWKCSNEHSWQATLNDRSRGSGCPTCAQSGFDPNESGWLYLIAHDSWGLLQIGITNNPDDRLSRHGRLGWTVLEIRGPMDGHTTRELETAILRLLRRSNAVMANKTDRSKFDGWAESWEIDSFPKRRLRELIDDAIN